MKSTRVAETGGCSGKYLILRLGREEFGIRIHEVIEIVRLQDITLLPQMPDVRQKLGLPEEPYTRRNCIVVVEVPGKAEPLLVGIVSEVGGEVLDLMAVDIADTRNFGIAH